MVRNGREAGGEGKENNVADPDRRGEFGRLVLTRGEKSRPWVSGGWD